MNPNLRRALILAFAFAVLFFTLGKFGVAASSERVHFAVPLLWLLDFFALRPGRKLPRAWQVVAVAGAALLLFWSFDSMAQAQAHYFSTYADWREGVARVWLVASLFVLYGIWSGFTLRALQRSPRLNNILQSPRGWPLRVARVVFALALFMPYVFTCFNAHRTKIANVANPRSAFKLDYEDVAFRARDGVKLSGWFIPAPRSRKTVLVCHGVGANKSIFLGVAPFLHRAGCNVLMFDFRGHGDSEGHTVSYGVHEARDVEAAVSYLHSRNLNDVVGYAFSMGGSALLYAVPRVKLRGVLLDSTFARFAPVAMGQMPVPSALRPLMLGIVSFYGWLELGVRLGDIEPRKYIAQISPRPLFIIHGTADTLVPPEQARENFEAAREPKTLWMVRNAPHCLCRPQNIVVYEKRATVFLNQCFS